MIGGRNPNHKNTFCDEPKLVEEKVEEVKEEVVEEVKEQSREEVRETMIALTKAEQVEYLIDDLGQDPKAVKKLKYEDDRVDKILEILFD